MRRVPKFGPLVVVLALSLGSVLALDGAPASAVVPAHSTAGNYTLKVDWTNPVIKDTLTMTLNADHSVDFSNEDVGNWSIAHKTITIFASSATYTGKKTTTGFKGTMSNTDGNSGTWKAIFLSAL
jgi:hypothetical protein